jgi:hypothetical protein
MGKFLGSNLSLDHIFWVVMHRGKTLIMDGSCKGGQLHWLAAALVGSCMGEQLQILGSWYGKSFTASSSTEVLVSHH